MIERGTSAAGSAFRIASISSSVKSSSVITRQSRRFWRLYSSIDMCTKLSRPLQVIVTGAAIAMPWTGSHCRRHSAEVTFSI
jgi:hypothetical protein